VQLVADAQPMLQPLLTLTLTLISPTHFEKHLLSEPEERADEMLVSGIAMQPFACVRAACCTTAPLP